MGWLGRQLDAERARWFLWLPVLFANGCLIYFCLPREPSITEIFGVSVLAILALALPRRSTVISVVAAIVLGTVSGFVAAKLRTEWVRAPVVSEWGGRATVTGVVRHVEVKETGGQRFVINVDAIEGLSADQTPARVRIQTRKVRADLLPGMRVRFKARLSPPPGPVVPGGYDFARWAYFKQLGGLGFAASPIEVLPPSNFEAASSPTFTVRVARLRQWISKRVQDTLPGQTGAIAAALITGERAGLSEDTNEAFRNSGLFHILSISGLHMAIMGGAIFFAVRFLLAAFPAFALRFAIKKWAAVAAIFGALGYLMISGGTFATLRSFVMIAVMFVAILLDRPALALRNVAAAALLLLVLFPESVLDAGFQMSFAAVVALIAGYEGFTTWWYSRRLRQGRPESPPGVITKAGLFLGGIVMSTVLAGGAVAPIAAYHFHTSQQLAVVANVLAVPLTNLIVMPAALATLLLMPFGAEAGMLQVMGFGIDGMTDVARWVSSLPGAVAAVPAFPAYAFMLIVMGGLWLALMATRWRLLGLAAVAAGVLLAPGLPRPDVLVGRNGRVIAVRGASGQLSALSQSRSTFALERWLERDGDVREPEQATVVTIRRGTRASRPDATSKKIAGGTKTGPGFGGRQGPFRCDPSGCIARVADRTIAVVRDTSALREDCQTAQIIIVLRTLPKRCRGGAAAGLTSQAVSMLEQNQRYSRLVIDAKTLRRKGAHAIYFEQDEGQAPATAGTTQVNTIGGAMTEVGLVSGPQKAPSKMHMRVVTVAQFRGLRPWTERAPRRWGTRHTNKRETGPATSAKDRGTDNNVDTTPRPADPSDSILIPINTGE